MSIELVELDEKEIKESSAIIIYGAEIWGMIAFNALENLGVLDKLSAIIDYRKAGKTFLGYHIQEPDSLRDSMNITNANNGSTLILVCASRGMGAICANLEKMGCKTAYHIAGLIKHIDENRFADVWNFSSKENMYEKYMIYVRYQEEGKLIIPHIGLMLTEFCTLNCKSCVEFIPYLSDKKEYSIERVIYIFQRLLECVDGVSEVDLVGGETLMKRGLQDIISWVCEQSKIQSVEIVTNATIIPDEQTLFAMKHSKARLILEDYGTYSSKKDELVKMCKQHGINYLVMKNEFWSDCTEAKFRDYDRNTLIDLYTNCLLANCFEIKGDYVIKCPVAYAYERLGKIPATQDYCINFGNDDFNISEYRKKLWELQNNVDYFEACKYCLGTGQDNIVPVAEQL